MKTVPQTRFFYTEPEPSASSFTFRSDLGIIGCIVSGLLLGLIVFALVSPEHGIPKVQEVIGITTQLEADIAQLTAENEQLLLQIEAIKTDPFWQEKIAREELNMALPGEIVYKFIQ
ncbi:hypothetical protein CSA56_04055 [candidate division KSB3 bacterium]|uniref:Septum formation initiator n=1 Tax=candidate division KSB3 bacterium TaxID=2044937 RepID=A0A2G6KK95_9BACT|nr:MAG: hypothetical protein CSA56_04055 [candidate division KSB3 bacterium]